MRLCALSITLLLRSSSRDRRVVTFPWTALLWEGLEALVANWRPADPGSIKDYYPPTCLEVVAQLLELCVKLPERAIRLILDESCQVHFACGANVNYFCLRPLDFPFRKSKNLSPDGTTKTIPVEKRATSLWNPTEGTPAPQPLWCSLQC